MKLEVNWITEMREFYDWLETNELSASAIAMWHALMHTCNKTKWQSTFEVAVKTLEWKSSFKKSELAVARNTLAQKGRIKWKSRGGNLSATYAMNFFSVHNADAEPDTAPAKNDERVRTVDTLPDTSADTSADANPTQVRNINKQNETETKQNNESLSQSGETPPVKNENLKNEKAAVSKKKRSSRKNPDAEPFWQSFVDAWFTWSASKPFKERPTFKGTSAPAHLLSIVKELKRRWLEKGNEWNQQTGNERLIAYLEACYADEWLCKHFLFKNLWSEFDRIIQEQSKIEPQKGKTGAAAPSLDPQRDTQLLYDAFRADSGKFGFRNVFPWHWSYLNLGYTNEAIAETRKRRIRFLTGGNEGSLIRLCQAYEQPDWQKQPLVIADKENFYPLCQRVSVVLYFVKLTVAGEKVITPLPKKT